MYMGMEVIKDNIECEQLLGENTADTVVKAEYVIPDTQPDVTEILMVDVKPVILSKEIMQDKVYIEGQINYNVLYRTIEDGQDDIYNVNYTGKFSNYIEIPGCEHNMLCEGECYVEHMGYTVVNERKVSVEGIIKLKAEVYKTYNFEIVKDITGISDIQIQKNPSSLDKVAGTASGDLIAKCHMEVPSDRPQIGSVIELKTNIHKSNVAIEEGKIKIDVSTSVKIIYKAMNIKDLSVLEGDASVTKEIDMDKATIDMDSYTDFIIDAVEYDIKEDDTGEKRIVDMEILIKTSTRLMYKEEMDMIEDAYSPSVITEIDKKDYELNVMHGQAFSEAVVKSDIEVPDGMPKVKDIVACLGNVCITEKKIIEDKVVIDGVLNADVIYKSSDEAKFINVISEEIPFTSSVDIPGTKIDMYGVAKVNLESVECSIEASNIALKAVVTSYARVNYIMHKEFLIGVNASEGEKPPKKASITIYVVQQGDTLWKIAKKYNTIIDELMKINEIDNPDLIKPGQKLIIPGRALM